MNCKTWKATKERAGYIKIGYDRSNLRFRHLLFVRVFSLLFVDNGTDWKNEVTAIDRMAKLTKEDIVAFANKYLKEDNYAVIYKKQGKDPNEKKMKKPEITPIITNRDVASPFLVEVQEGAVKPIEPVFLDYQKDMSQLKAKSDIPVLYKQNVANDLFQLIYVFDKGNNHDKALGTAFDYLEYLGTSDMTPEELKSEFYRLACTFYVSPGNERTYVVLSGLNENMPAAVQLFEKLLAGDLGPYMAKLIKRDKFCP